MGHDIANVVFKTEKFKRGSTVQKQKGSNIELGIKVMELAIDYPNCPEKGLTFLKNLYCGINKWNKAINVSEKLFNLNPHPNYLTSIFYNALKAERQDVIDKYLDFSLKNKKFLENPYSLANILYILNKKETIKDSKIALKLTKNYWRFFKNQRHKKRLPSVWVNMTYTYAAADKMDEIFGEIVNDVLKNLKEMPPDIYENIAWFYLKKKQIDKCIYYLKEGKKKNAPKYDSKYFKALADNPEFLKLFD